MTSHSFESPAAAPAPLAVPISHGRAALTRAWRVIDFFAARGAADYYAYGRWRMSRWLHGTAPRAFDVDTTALFRAVNVQKLDSTGHAETALSRRLAAHFRARRDPRFFVRPGDRAAFSSVPKAMQAETIRQADLICANEFCFRGTTPVRFQNGIDWTYTPQGNVDWRWDLNRHAYWVTLGRAYWYTANERYALKWRALLADWLSQNPARTDQLNWTSAFEVGFRIHSWLWSFYLVRDAPALDDESVLLWLQGLLAHGRYLNAQIELHVPNNHLLLQAKALAFLGLLLPEFPEAETWRERGMQLLAAQLSAQVCADGVHGERTMLYHQIVASELLELVVLMDMNRIPLPPEWKTTLDKMVQAEAAFTKPDGTLPLLGDSAQHDTHLRVSAARAGRLFLRGTFDTPPDEATYWLLGPARVDAAHRVPPPPGCARALRDGGYFISRSGQGADARYLVFDAGPFGFKPMPNHGHADALSFELFAYGETLLVDPGYYSTSLGAEWRNFFRGTRAHNTAVVDDLDQSELLDVRRVYRPAQTTLLDWRTNDTLDLADAAHDGYERLAQPVTHRRQILFVKPAYWVVVDWFTGRGEHQFDLYFHLMPSTIVQVDAGSGAAVCATKKAGLVVQFLAGNGQIQVIEGATDPIQGWVSLESGVKRAAPVVRYRCRAAPPLAVCTLLYPYRGVPPPLRAERIPVNGGAQVPALALGITTDTCTDYIMLDHTEGERKQFAGYVTDARLLYVRQDAAKQKPTHAVRTGGQAAWFQGQTMPAATL